MATTSLPERNLGTRSQELLADPRWQLVERVVASPHLARSGRLCAFLQFVCEETLLGRGDQLNEQKIGIHVFERKLGYNASDDNIVRSHASRLRQRLDAYSLLEAHNESLRLTLPRGGYVPQFTQHVAAIEECETAAITAETFLRDRAEENAIPKRARRLSIILLSIALIAMFSLTVWQWIAKRSLLRRTRTDSPVMRALWGELFVPGKQTLIVPADSTLVIFENLTGKTVPLRSYIDKSYLAGEAPVPPQGPEQIARWAAHRRLTSVADIEITSELFRVPEAGQASPIVRFARDLQVSDFKGTNGVLIGAREANPWLIMFEAHRNFTIEDDQQTRVFTVLNRSPRSGEMPKYQTKPGDPNHVAYALIALVPNLDNSGYVLILEGTSIAGTEAAADFLTHTPSQIEPVLAPVFQQYGRITPFEVLLETTNLNGSASQSRVLASRSAP